MGKFVISPRVRFTVPVEAETITPESLSAKTLAEVRNLPVWEGNRKALLGDLFDVDVAEVSEPGLHVELNGDFSKVRYVGKGMKSGSITVKGPVGNHLGERMEGGRITVNGDAGSWLGGAMKNGTIEVFGNVGDCVGVPYRGSLRVMRGGTVIVHGNAGDEVGGSMREGYIQVDGDVGQFAGVKMSGGTILIRGSSAGRLGPGMRGGRIVLLGHVESILPSFTVDELRPQVRVGEDRLKGPFLVFQGDLNERGSGRLFVMREKNPQLSAYEALIE
ncbi:MAG: formylmethanofuran dehydrogenase subunit C [Candidatus Bathyarchaeia archaeon]